jgi:hypothetical protein
VRGEKGMRRKKEKKTRFEKLSDTDVRRLLYTIGITEPTPEQIEGVRDMQGYLYSMQSTLRLLEDPMPRVRTENLPSLRQAMIDAHPDRGGTAEAFIAARQRYIDARRQK